MKTDIEIQQDVMEELKWAPLLNSAEIGVAVKNGIVSLSGIVDSYAKKVAAERVVKKIEGVRAVAEEIEVKFSDGGMRDDIEIAEVVLNALKWQTTIDDKKIRVKVENGWVTLEGEVEWIFDRNHVVSSVENLIGVRGITCHIKVMPLTPLKAVERKICAALHRAATIDASNISIETIGNTIILTGTVRSLSEKEDAEDAAWSAPGVTEVRNELEINISKTPKINL